jgi:hypothetical protein
VLFSREIGADRSGGSTDVGRGRGMTVVVTVIVIRVQVSRALRSASFSSIGRAEGGNSTGGLIKCSFLVLRDGLAAIALGTHLGGEGIAPELLLAGTGVAVRFARSLELLFDRALALLTALRLGRVGEEVAPGLRSGLAELKRDVAMASARSRCVGVDWAVQVSGKEEGAAAHLGVPPGEEEIDRALGNAGQSYLHLDHALPLHPPPARRHRHCGDGPRISPELLFWYMLLSR